MTPSAPHPFGRPFTFVPNQIWKSIGKIISLTDSIEGRSFVHMFRCTLSFETKSYKVTPCVDTSPPSFLFTPSPLSFSKLGPCLPLRIVRPEFVRPEVLHKEIINFESMFTVS